VVIGEAPPVDASGISTSHGHGTFNGTTDWADAY